MGIQTPLHAWLQSPPSSQNSDTSEDAPTTASTKRKRAASAPPELSPTNPARRFKKPRSTPSAPKRAKRAQKLYDLTIAAIDNSGRAIDAQVDKYLEGGPYRGWCTSDDYAAEMAQYVPAVHALLDLDSLQHAFDLLLYIGPQTHGDLEAHCKMSGYGGNEDVWRNMDEAMLRAIEMRTQTQARPSRAHGKGPLSEQRRGTCTDWVGDALAELVEERDRLDQFGMEGYFKRSIAALEGMKGPA